MATVYAYTSPAKGHLYPIVPTLLALRARGTRVHVRTLAGEVERMRALGLDASAIADGIEGRPLDDWRATSPPGALDRTLAAWLDRAQHEIPDFQAGFSESGADCALVDINSLGALAAAEASGRPFVVFSPYFLPVCVPGRPPVGMGMPQDTGLFGRMRDAVLWTVIRFLTRKHRARLNRLRATLGLAPIGDVYQTTSAANRVLALTAEPFEYAHESWPANVRFVGPGIWEPDAAPAMRGERPLVLVTCSTEFQDDGRLIQTALDALADADVDVVATTGAIDPSGFRVPANASVVRFAAHGALLPRAVAVVCHGGMGITQKALAAGVPVCVVPFGRDQLDVGCHVVRANAGAVLPKSRLSVPALRDAIREAREKRDGALVLAAAFAASPGPEGAAGVIEELCAAG